MDVNQTHSGDHFAMYTNIESLYCIPETDIMLYVNCISIKKKVKGRPFCLKTIDVLLPSGND